jgi:Transposase IS116/IS110/IS902 family
VGGVGRCQPAGRRLLGVLSGCRTGSWFRRKRRGWCARRGDFGCPVPVLVDPELPPRPGSLRQLGQVRLEAWLRDHKIRNATTVATAAIDAANAQHASITDEQLAAHIVTKLSNEAIRLNEEIAEIENLIDDRLRPHQHAEIILSMPGLGLLLGAEFLAATGGDMTQFDSPDRLPTSPASHPHPHRETPGRLRGNLRRPRRYDRRLLRASCLAALASIRWCPASKSYYQRKRVEGKRHVQAVIALARRRLNVCSETTSNTKPTSQPQLDNDIENHSQCPSTAPQPGVSGRTHRSRNSLVPKTRGWHVITVTVETNRPQPVSEHWQSSTSWAQTTHRVTLSSNCPVLRVAD